ncbi:MAG: ATP-binding cassette domain-containing protein [Candidatus Eremiobacteraeota bacterium]|nr:ATP-binding cassette domain-containing protein [Candidatus Eremiobacteraeota bacterium]
MRPALTLRRAGIRRGGRWIWRDASLDVPAGAFVGVVGPNGAGKSTLLRAALGLLPLDEGTITVFGAPPRRGSRTVGYMPQVRGDAGMPIRGRDVVRFGADGDRWGFALHGPASRRRRAHVDAAIAAVGAAAYAHRPIGRVSGGEAQRLFLAQALVGEPRLLVLDEPLANLDLAHQASVLALVASLARERAMTVLLVAHNVNGLLPYLDRVVYVANGRIAAGTPDEVVTSETLSRIYGAPVEVLFDRHGRRVVAGVDHG